MCVRPNNDRMPHFSVPDAFAYRLENSLGHHRRLRVRQGEQLLYRHCAHLCRYVIPRCHTLVSHTQVCHTSMSRTVSLRSCFDVRARASAPRSKGTVRPALFMGEGLRKSYACTGSTHHPHQHNNADKNKNGAPRATEL